MGALALKISELAAGQAKLAEAIALIGKTPATDHFGSHARFSGGTHVVDTKEGKGLGFARAIRCFALADLERKSPMEIAERVDRSSGSPYGDKLKATIKALGESTAGAGGVFAPDEFSSDFIELLRPQTALAKAGVRVITMNKQSLTRGRQATASTATWKGEAQPITYSQPSFDAPQLNLKDLGITCAINNDLLRDQDISSDIIVRDDLVKVALLAIDLAGIRGLGTSFSPKGIRYWVPASTNVNGSSAGMGVPSLQNASTDIQVKGKQVLNNANVPTKTRAMLVNPRITAGFLTLRDGIGGFPLAAEQALKGTFFGLPVIETTQIPINLSGGGSGGSLESEIYIIEATEIEMGMGLQPTVETSREASYHDAAGVQQNAFENDQTLVRMLARADWIMRHNVGVAVINGCTYGT